jgi:hypothetical protein
MIYPQKETTSLKHCQDTGLHPLRHAYQKGNNDQSTIDHAVQNSIYRTGLPRGLPGTVFWLVDVRL